MATIEHKFSTCPHDCPSTCALDVEVIDGLRIGRVRGAEDNSYTAGVICAKVGRYAERIHHADRLLYPLKRTGKKGAGQFTRISWEEAIALTADGLNHAEASFGSQSVWPYYYAGTMGMVMRDGINRLRNVKKYSGQLNTICTTIAWTGFIAGTGKLAGADPREMATSDCVVIWGTNAVHTQVHVMTHAMRARKERGAKIVVIDIYNNPTMEQADMAMLVKPGTDGALACAVMHVLFRDGYADWDYLKRYTDCPEDLQKHLATRDPVWASAITGLSVEEIVAFAHLVGKTKRTFFRLGYGFGRQRNGAVNMHAALSIPAVTGAWQYEGGGAFHGNSGIYRWQKQAIEGSNYKDPGVRTLDQSQIGRILTGDKVALRHGPPVKAMFIQNTNPASVAPEQELVKQGFLRDDLFLCVHEQFMTETALMADVVLPATMFMEHDDLYQGGGHQHIMLGPELIKAPGECKSNHEVICLLAKAVDARDRNFEVEPNDLIETTLRDSGRGTLDNLREKKWIDIQPPFREAHYLNGFAHADKKFHFRPAWSTVPNTNDGLKGPWQQMPELPDHWSIIEHETSEHPFRLATSPARNFLNSSFNETKTSLAKEKHPTLLIHPQDAEILKVEDGAWVRLTNHRGEVLIRTKRFSGLRRGVVIAESIWPNHAYPDGRGINTLTGADAVAPFGGAAFHDNRVAIVPL